MKNKTLVVCPAFNEEQTVGAVIQNTLSVLKHSRLAELCDILVIDDGSSDTTAEIVSPFDVKFLSHRKNYGYGHTLRSGFEYASHHHYKYLVTMDTDGQHDPSLLPYFINQPDDYDIVSGSRYLPLSPRLSTPPAPHINKFFTNLINEITRYCITDIGCGMKRISVSITKNLNLKESGYGFPLEFWLLCDEQLASISEIPIPLVYVDPSRHFGTKFPSVEVGVDYCIFVILRTLLNIRESFTYRDDYVQFFMEIVSHVDSSVKDKIKTIYRHLEIACLSDFPGMLALTKMNELENKL